MNKFILVCDDDKALTKEISQSIEKNKDKACTAISTYAKEEAFEAIDKYYFPVAIIDLNLEGPLPLDWSNTGGIKVIEKLRNLDFGTKIIVVSANPETELAFSLHKEFNIFDYVQKGNSINSFSHLMAVIDSAIDESEIQLPKPIMFSFLGASGADKEVLESNILSYLNVKGGSNTLENIAQKVLAYVYPWRLKENSKFILDKVNKYAFTSFWSYLRAERVGVILCNENNAVRPSKCFDDIEQILEIYIVKNVKIFIVKLGS